MTRPSNRESRVDDWSEFNPDELGRRIRAQRTRLGLTQEALAERADVSKETIGRMEQGIASPTLDTLFKVAKGLETTGAALIAEHAADELSELVKELPEHEQEIARVMIRALSAHVVGQ